MQAFAQALFAPYRSIQENAGVPGGMELEEYVVDMAPIVARHVARRWSDLENWKAKPEPQDQEA